MVSARVVAGRPTDVIDLRREQAGFWSKDGRMQRAIAMQGRRQPESVRIDEAEVTRRWISTTMRDAELYWVAPDMVDLLAALAPSMPDVHPRPPCPEALVVMGKAISGVDAVTGGPIFTAAYLWGPITVNSTPCLEIETFGLRDSMAELLDFSAKERDLWRRSIPTKLVSTGGSEWPWSNTTSDFSFVSAENQKMENSMIEDRRVMAAFWSLIEQKLTVETLHTGDRAAQRRATRSGMKFNPNPVRVIKLRERMSRPTSEAGMTEVEWSHRWLVTSHWRRQYYPSTGEHHAKLIDSYVKGPPDKPFIPKQTVKALVR